MKFARCKQRIGHSWLDVPVIHAHGGRSRRVVDQAHYSILVEDTAFYTIWQNERDSGPKPYFLFREKPLARNRPVHFCAIHGKEQLARYVDKITKRGEAIGEAYIAKKNRLAQNRANVNSETDKNTENT